MMQGTSKPFLVHLGSIRVRPQGSLQMGMRHHVTKVAVETKLLVLPCPAFSKRAQLLGTAWFFGTTWFFGWRRWPESHRWPWVVQITAWEVQVLIMATVDGCSCWWLMADVVMKFLPFLKPRWMLIIERWSKFYPFMSGTIYKCAKFKCWLPWSQTWWGNHFFGS